ncbi:MAG TPA: AraC family transcriptional regulator [Blastocatellia bacterium]|nr:AraC family transcriptional regulator [Blastocatellia bacterium]
MKMSPEITKPMKALEPGDSNPQPGKLLEERIFITGTPSLPGIEIMDVKRSERLWRVFHDSYEICSVFRSENKRSCFSQGYCAWRYRARDFMGTEGTLMFVEPGETHITTSVTGPGTFRVLRIDPHIMEEAVEEHGLASIPHLKGFETRRTDWFKVFAEFHQSCENGAPALEIQSRYTRCVALLLTHFIEESVAAPKRIDDGRLLRARDYIEDNYRENITLDELAKEASITKFHLTREFTRRFGAPPHEYLNMVRISRAMESLRSGQSISVSALEAGFFDQSHFTRHFKRCYGITPGEFQVGINISGPANHMRR